MKLLEMFAKNTDFEVLANFLYELLQLAGADVRNARPSTKDRAKLGTLFVPCILSGIFHLTYLWDNYNVRSFGGAMIIALSVVNIFVKIVAITQNAKEVDAILQTIVKRTCSKIRLSKCCPEERQLIEKYSGITHKITIVVIVSFVVGCTLIYILPYLISLAVPRLWIFANDFKIPGISANSHPGYDLHCFLIQYSIAYMSTMFMASDLLFLFCAMYITLQFDICALYVGQWNDGDSTVDLRRIIIQHTHVFEFCNRTSKLLQLIILVELLLGVLYIVICITLFNEDTIYFMIVLFICVLQLLILCYFGQIIKNKAYDTAYVIYFCNWLEFERRSDKSGYLQLVKGSQVDVAIKPFLLFSLSLESFVQIIKTAYSYYAFLQNVV